MVLDHMAQSTRCQTAQSERKYGYKLLPICSRNIEPIHSPNTMALPRVSKHKKQLCCVSTPHGNQNLLILILILILIYFSTLPKDSKPRTVCCVPAPQVNKRPVDSRYSISTSIFGLVETCPRCTYFFNFSPVWCASRHF